jgi:hypothetical protein
VPQATLRLELSSDVGVDEHATQYDLNQEADNKNDEESKSHVGKERLAVLEEGTALKRGKARQLYTWLVALSASPADPTHCERLGLAKTGELHERGVTAIFR